MGRKSTQLAPEVIPDEATIRWGAETFETRVGFMPYGPRVALYVYSNDEKTLTRLRTNFGGRVVRVASTQRWMLYGDLLNAFLHQIKPFVTKETSKVKIDMTLDVLAQEKVTIRSTQDDMVLLTAAATATGASGAPVPVPAVDAAEIRITGNIPPPPWDEDEPLLDIAKATPGGMDLQAGSLENAEGFAKLARANGLKAELVQVHKKVVVRLTKGD